MLVHFVAQARIADLVEAQKLIEALRAAVWHEKTVKSDGKTRLTEGLDRPSLTENAGTGRYQNVLAAVGARVDLRAESRLLPRGRSRSADATVVGSAFLQDNLFNNPSESEGFEASFATVSSRESRTRLSVRIDIETKRLDWLAKRSGRSKSFLAAEAIAAFVEAESW